MNPKQILENLSAHLKNTLARAIGLATSYTHTEVRPIHLLLSLLQEPGSVGSEILHKVNLNEPAILKILKEFKPPSTTTRGSTRTAALAELGADSKKALEKAMLLAYEYEQNYVGTEHLLYGILHSHDQEVETLWKREKINPQEMEDQVLHILENTNKFPDVSDINSMIEEISEISENQATQQPREPAPQTEKKSKTKASALELFTIDLTKKQEQKNIDPVIGRESEIERLIHILSRRTKNNPVLVGEPGVGKTAIVEGLAKKILEGDVPDILKRKQILSLDLTLLISGTIYRGEFEARLRQIIEEVSKKPNTILFIDEIHNIIGAGSNQGTMDAANILKPALARGRLRCIGATTIDEYKKYMTHDPALERRFQSIEVEEPTREEAIQILTGISPLYEKYHHVKITPEVIERAVDLSIKYVHDNFLPDKAIDLLDESSASKKVAMPDHPLKTELLQLEQDLSEAQEQKQECILNEEFEAAKKWKSKESKLTKKISEQKKKIKKLKAPKKQPLRIEDVARVLARRMHTTEDIFLQDEFTALQNLEKTLGSEIFGQKPVLETIVRTLQRSSLGIRNTRRPFASFLFVGPTGVGKTELAKLLAKRIFHDEKALLKIDMSEFGEQHGVSKLLGSPAGYIGYKERNRFTESIRQRPYSVVLFDEVDKGHPDVLKLLLQILDEGELTDSSGKKLSFRHAIVILTSNIGAELFKHPGIGFGNAHTGILSKEKELQMKAELKEAFGSPLLGRLDATCVFSPLSQNDLRDILKEKIKHIDNSLKHTHRLSIGIETTALDALLQQIEQDLGARPLQQTLETILYPLLFEQVRQKTSKKKLKLRYQKEHFSLE